MSRPPVRRLPRVRKLAAIAGLVSLAAGLTLLPAASRSAAAAAARGSSAVTVHGAHLWDWANQQPLATASTVRVSQTSNLVNELVQVSWSNFTPSINPVSQIWYTFNGSHYAVMVAQCRGLKPTGWKDCYGADQFGVASTSGPDGPMNTAYGVTGADGTGQVNIDVETRLENHFLGCDHEHPCSLVIVPGQGGQRGHCSEHSADVNGNGGTSSPVSTFTSSLSGTGACSWKDRLVVPLRFAKAPSGCPIRNARFSIAGSPMMGRAMAQWLTGLCEGAHGMTIAYSSAVAEPLAVTEAASGLTDVALTTRPASATGVQFGSKHFVYAPVAVTAASIAFWIDDSSRDGRPFTRLKLNQRLVAKLVTTSYNFENIGCVKGGPRPCDKAVSGNPVRLYADPEFTKLNPQMTEAATASDAPFQIPTVQSGNSDMTWTVTRWIAADGDARAFMAGQPDPWHTHANTHYRGLKYPVDAFTAQDPFLVLAHQYSPAFPLAQVVAYQALNQDAGTSWVKDSNGNFPKDPIWAAGQRSLIAILDQGDAVIDRFPVAAIANKAGNYVTPSNASMAAAVAHMTRAGSGTQQVNQASMDPKAYPLTMIVYAMAPTSGLSHPKAAAIARFIDFAAGAGQKTGLAPGRLPPGYLPLPARLAAQARAAARQVANQTGATPAPPQTSGSGSASTPASAAGAGGTPSAASPSPGPKLSLPPNQLTGQRIKFVAVAHPPAAPFTRFALPALLILGGLAALAGSFAMAGSVDGGFRARLRRIGRDGAAWTRGTWSRATRRPGTRPPPGSRPPPAGTRPAKDRLPWRRKR